MLTKDDYIAFRRKYEPKTVKLVVVAESPPKTGMYFYKPDGSPKKELLFKALMKQLGCSPKTKDEGLREFQRQDWVLVDATYQPVGGLTEKQKREDLDRMSHDRSVPIILVKKNVCQLLDHR